MFNKKNKLNLIFQTLICLVFFNYKSLVRTIFKLEQNLVCKKGKQYYYKKQNVYICITSTKCVGGTTTKK